MQSKVGFEALKDHGVPIERKGKLLSSIYSQGNFCSLIKNFSLMSNLEAEYEGASRETNQNRSILYDTKISLMIPTSGR